MLGDWAQAGYGDAYRAYQPYYYAQGVANGAYPAGAGAGVGAGGVDQSTTTIGTQIKVRRGLLAAALSGSCVRGRGGWRERRGGGWWTGRNRRGRDQGGPGRSDGAARVREAR